jgi:hypothetical protein
MFIKKALIIMLFCTASLAQIGNYKTNNYTAWKVLKGNAKDKYIEVISMDNLEPEKLNPICLSDNKMIFKYEMMGHEDSFYDASSKNINVESIRQASYKSIVFALKIDIEEDNDSDGKLNEQYNKICSDNKSIRFNSTMRSKNGVNYHGVVKYIGDVTIAPPF